MMETDVSKLQLTFKKIIECSDEIKNCCTESPGCSSTNQQNSGAEKSTEHRSRIAELLNRQLQLSLEALSCVTVRKPFSETVRMKFHDEKSGETMGSRGLSEILLLIDEYAETLPLHVEPYNYKKTELAQKRPISALCPPLVGSIPLPDTEEVPIGSLVAVWKKEEDQRESKWILAEVIDQSAGVRGRGRYTLLDHVAEYEYYRNYFILSRTPPVTPNVKYSLVRQKLPFLLKKVPRQDIIPLPRFRADPRHNASALFGPGSLVMARFPKTSVFYCACVIAPPERLRDGYCVTFDMKSEFNCQGNGSKNETVQSYVIPQLYVVQNPPGKRHSRMPHERQTDEE
ncbi:hypothetical protein niasHS_002679 [Heterodera schachtii]|uniref:SGF29 C-terminal domain-containing protein n=1 Tax=Heterodera schachtii TaxID=97005 RepID=A0ABD2K282_HETSC